MLKLEELILLDILRNENINVIKRKFQNFDINYDEVIKLSINQKIFVLTFEKIKLLNSEHTSKINFYNTIIKYELSKKLKLYLQIIQLLNNSNIDYIVIKGFLLGKLIYDDTSTRIFSDLDLIINEQDYNKVINLLTNNNFNIVSYDKINDFKQDEYKIVIEHQCENYTIELKFNHRQLTIDLLNEPNRKKINIENVIVNTNSYELNLLSQLIYINLYFNDPNSIINDNKLILRFHVDLYYYIKKYSDLFNYSYLNKIIYELKFKQNLTKIIKELYIIFNDISLFDFIKKIVVGFEFLDLCEKKSDILIMSLRNCEYRNNYIQYYLKNIILGKNSVVKNNYNYKVDNNHITLNGNIAYKNLILDINIEDLSSHKNLLFIIKLFYINEYNDYIYPYDCYTLKLIDFPKIYNYFTFEKGKYDGIYCKEKELDNPFGKNILKVTGTPQKFNLKFDFSKEKWFQVFNEKIGLNIEIWGVVDDKIFFIDRISDDTNPLIFITRSSTNEDI